MPLSLREVLRSFTATIITGGSSGLGQAFIELGAKLNPDAAFCNLSRTTPAGFSAGISLHHIPCDLGRGEEVEHAARQVEAWLQRTPTGRVLLINNSGFGTYGVFPEPNLSRQLEMIDVNVRAVVQLTALLMPALRARGGAIVTVASTAAFQPTPYAATYGATKAFVLHWTLALNEELRGTNLRAIAVCPGPTRTRFFQVAGLAEGSVPKSVSMSAQDVVRATLSALGGSRSQVVPGWKNRLAAFFASRSPKPLAARVAARLLRRYRLNRIAR